MEGTALSLHGAALSLDGTALAREGTALALEGTDSPRERRETSFDRVIVIGDGQQVAQLLFDCRRVGVSASLAV